MKHFYNFLFILIATTIYAQESFTLTVPVDRYQVDTTNAIIICNTDISQYQDLSSYETLVLALDSMYTFTSNPGTISHEASYIVQKEGKDYRLYFSSFPVIAINADEIIDDPKRPATFVYAGEDGIKKSDAGIEVRGGFSQTFPKKTYDLEFWEDATGEDNRDLQFGNLREDDDWVLDALYNEPLRLRAFSGHKLWLDIHTPYYLDEEEDAKSGADVMYVDVFLNNKYNGVYMLSEQVDSKQLELKSFKDGEIRGELYKAEEVINRATWFTNATPYDNTKNTWDGFELKHPDEDNIIDWSKLYNFVDFVANSAEQEFNEGIAEKVHIGNTIDYFLFLNFLRAPDNRGKNYYIGKYNLENPYFFVPWDLDGTFGINYDGTYLDITDDILSNSLFNRLFIYTPTEEMKQKIYARYIQLREGVMSNEQILQRLDDNYSLLKDTKVYEREALVWPNYPYDEDAKNYIDNWMTDRLIYLDSYFEDYNLGIAPLSQKQQALTLYPNPASTQINVVSELTQEKPYAIYNVQGQRVLKGNLQPANRTIKIETLRAGIYLLQLEGITKKFIVQR